MNLTMAFGPCLQHPGTEGPVHGDHAVVDEMDVDPSDAVPDLNHHRLGLKASSVVVYLNLV
jgi:hypothetical protein